MHAQQRQSRIPEQQGIGQTLPPVPVGMDNMHTAPSPSGAMPSGTRLQVGKYQAIIHNFIAEGGFAHVYLARIEGKSGYVVLKRVAVPDAERLKMVEKEIEFMRRLGDHKYIVRYYASRVDALPIGGFEALILMEYCPGGGVIDLMNRRLQHRLTEPEILKIFGNVCEALAYMHYCQPPVLHRDLKVENILILSQDQYKLCDFGSAALSNGSYIPTTLQEIQKVEDDVQRHTTLQYRAPEMIDIYQKRPINEKADIWALGVLLYKLCYYTTPFEEQGQLAILNAHYTIPQSPYFSDGLRQLIIAMLQEDQQRRPNIYQVVKTVSDLMHVECPIRNIYKDTNPSPIPRHDSPVASSGNDSSSSSIFEKLPSLPQQLPDITPMRRGRPTRQENRLSGTPTSSPPISTPPPPPSQPPSASVSASFDPFDPTQVKVQGDQDLDSTTARSTKSPLSSSSSSASGTPKFGFENRFDDSGFSSSSFTNHGDDEWITDDISSSTTYPWQLEAQQLDSISIPPQQKEQQQPRHHRTTSLSPRMKAVLLQQQFTHSGSTSKSTTIIPSITKSTTKSTKNIRNFMEKKRAPYTSSATATLSPVPTATTSSSLPATLPSLSLSPSPSSSSPKINHNIESSSHKEGGSYRPKPPPKPARFRASKPSDVGNIPSASSSPPPTLLSSSSSSPPLASPLMRPPSISEFEEKFPSLEDL
ncbi:unnamed protein product [Absidia cylindrospora]